MARTILLATVARRQGISFQLKTAGYQVIGTMTLNPATARHEMELTEADFLKHSKELARLCAVPGLGWYVVEFRDKLSDEELDRCGEELKSIGANPMGVKDDLTGKRFFALRRIAKDLGIDVDDPANKGVDNLRRLIRYKRFLNAKAEQPA